MTRLPVGLKVDARCARAGGDRHRVDPVPLLQRADDPPQREALAHARAAGEEEGAAGEGHRQRALLVRVEVGGGVEEGRRLLRRWRRRGEACR